MVWIPCNHHDGRAGIADSRDDVLDLPASLSHGMIDDELAAAYVDTGPEMVRWLEANTPVRSGSSRASPTTTPSIPAGSPAAAGRSSARCSRSTSSAPWADRVTVGPQMGATSP